MNYADIKQYDVANGLGTEFPCLSAAVRIIVKNCFNKETWDFRILEILYRSRD